MQHLGHQQGGGAVRRADDADGGRVLQVKAQRSGQDDGEENPRLGGRAAQKQPGVGKQRAKVNHSADADEQQDRHGLTGLNAHLKQPLNDTVGLPHPLAELVNDPGQREVD